MYQGLNKDIDKGIQSITEFNEINKAAIGQLMSTRSNCFSELFSLGLKQTQAISDVLGQGKKPKVAVDLHEEYLKSLESIFANTIEQEVNILNKTQEQLFTLAEKRIAELSELSMFSEAAKKPAVQPVQEKQPAKKTRVKRTAKASTSPSRTAAKTETSTNHSITESKETSTKPA